MLLKPQNKKLIFAVKATYSKSGCAYISTTKLWIDNKEVESKTKEWIDLRNPATDEIITRVPKTTPQEMAQATESCKQAYKKWSQTSILQRQQCMFKLQELIKRDLKKIAENITQEQGKTLPDAEGDVMRGLQVVEHACSATSLLLGESLPNISKDLDTISYRVPLGVTAGITPFNFPAMIPLWMFPVSLVCGNTMLMKPSERDPGACMMLMKLTKEAGVPDGCVNVIHGAHEDHNIKKVVRIGELELWFAATLGYWPQRPFEPERVPIGGVEWCLKGFDTSIFRGLKIIGFDVEKVQKDKVGSLPYKVPLSNPLGQEFARLLSLSHLDGSTYVIDLIDVTPQEWEQLIAFLSKVDHLVVGFKVIDDLVSILNVHGAGQADLSHDKTKIIRSLIIDGFGRYWDSEICVRLMTGGKSKLTKELGLCPESFGLKGIFTEFFLADVGKYQCDFADRKVQERFLQNKISDDDIIYAGLDAYYSMALFMAFLHYGFTGELTGLMALWPHDWLPEDQVKIIAFRFYEVYSQDLCGFEEKNFVEQKDIVSKQLTKVYHMMRQEMLARWATHMQDDLPSYSCPADIHNPAKAKDRIVISGIYPKVLHAKPSAKKRNNWEDESDPEELESDYQLTNRKGEVNIRLHTEMMQGKSFFDLSDPVDIVWYITANLAMNKNPKTNWGENLRKFMMGTDCFEPFGVDNGMCKYVKDHWKADLLQYSHILDANKFDALEQACNLIPLPFFVFWPHSRAEYDFIIQELLSYNFLKTYTDQQKEQIKRMAWKTPERVLQNHELVRQLPLTEPETITKGVRIKTWGNRFGFMPLRFRLKDKFGSPVSTEKRKNSITSNRDYWANPFFYTRFYYSEFGVTTPSLRYGLKKDTKTMQPGQVRCIPSDFPMYPFAFPEKCIHRRPLPSELPMTTYYESYNPSEFDVGTKSTEPDNPSGKTELNEDVTEEDYEDSAVEDKSSAEQNTDMVVDDEDRLLYIAVPDSPVPTTSVDVQPVVATPVTLQPQQTGIMLPPGYKGPPPGLQSQTEMDASQYLSSVQTASHTEETPMAVDIVDTKEEPKEVEMSDQSSATADNASTSKETSQEAEARRLADEEEFKRLAPFFDTHGVPGIYTVEAIQNMRTEKHMSDATIWANVKKKRKHKLKAEEKKQKAKVQVPVTKTEASDTSTLASTTDTVTTTVSSTPASSSQAPTTSTTQSISLVSTPSTQFLSQTSDTAGAWKKPLKKGEQAKASHVTPLATAGQGQQLFTPGKIKQLTLNTVDPSQQTPEMTVELFKDILLEFWEQTKAKGRAKGHISFATNEVANYFCDESFESPDIWTMVNLAVKKIYNAYQTQFDVQGGFLYDSKNIPDVIWMDIMKMIIPEWLSEYSASMAFTATKYLCLMVFLMLDCHPLTAEQIGKWLASAKAYANVKLLKEYHSQTAPVVFKNAYRLVMYNSSKQAAEMRSKRLASISPPTTAKFSKVQDNAGKTQKVPVSAGIQPTTSQAATSVTGQSSQGSSMSQSTPSSSQQQQPGQQPAARGARGGQGRGGRGRGGQPNFHFQNPNRGGQAGGQNVHRGRGGGRGRAGRGRGGQGRGGQQQNQPQQPQAGGQQQ